MAASKSTKPRVVALRFTKAQFMSLTPAERELLIRVGLAQNDLLMMQRLWGALYYRRPQTTWATEAHAIQQVTLLLVLVGKLFEALEVFRRRFQRSAMHREYLERFNDQQRKAAEILKRALGKDNLLASVRNDFAFHYHNDARLSRFMKRWSADRLLTMYFGDPDANTLNAYAAEPFLRALMRRTGRRSPAAALRYIQNRAAEVVQAHSIFVGAVQVVAIGKMFSTKPQPEEIHILDDEYLPHDQFVIPFFMGLPSRPPREIRAEMKRQRELR